jgi:hypothetical protein
MLDREAGKSMERKPLILTYFSLLTPMMLRGAEGRRTGASEVHNLLRGSGREKDVRVRNDDQRVGEWSMLLLTGT